MFPVHRLCMKLEFENLNILRQKYHCEDCRFCEICYTTDLIVRALKENIYSYNIELIFLLRISYLF